MPNLLCMLDGACPQNGDTLSKGTLAKGFVPRSIRQRCFSSKKWTPPSKISSGDIPNSMWNPGGTLTLVEASWKPRGTLPPGRPGRPRSLSGLRPQSFQLLGNKIVVFLLVSLKNCQKKYPEKRETHVCVDLLYTAPARNTDPHEKRTRPPFLCLGDGVICCIPAFV